MYSGQDWLQKNPHRDVRVVTRRPVRATSSHFLMLLLGLAALVNVASAKRPDFCETHAGHEEENGREWMMMSIFCRDRATAPASTYHRQMSPHGSGAAGGQLDSLTA